MSDIRNIVTCVIAALAIFCPAKANAHDTWVQTNTNLIRVGDAVHIDLMLGNHGNAHRDFRLASKLDLAGAAIVVVAPDGKHYDIKDRMVDTGYTPKEGYWTTTFAADKPGLYLVSQTYDAVVSYAPERAIKSAKTFFVASASLDNPNASSPGFDKPLGHPLEIVPLMNPVLPVGPGTQFTVQVLYKGKPLAGQSVAFLPQGVQAKEGAKDERYERTTDANGIATFEAKEASYYLIVAHKEEKSEGGTFNGKPYEFTNYGATLNIYVPQICPCCGG